ncbi:hypothetical protein SLS55_001693 [Diplodia seriata]|uniref:Uncharacterized protein n=1 Tax=Diplodia seriata TaxID=420778 RepID=A0ABR3CQ09_9PEZI
MSQNNPLDKICRAFKIGPLDWSKGSAATHIFNPEDRHEHAPHPEYFTKDDLTYLKNFKNLTRLRVYNMPDSFQSVIWETVWNNPSLDTLELSMRYNPITRDIDNDTPPQILCFGFLII